MLSICPSSIKWAVPRWRQDLLENRLVSSLVEIQIVNVDSLASTQCSIEGVKRVSQVFLVKDYT